MMASLLQATNYKLQAGRGFTLIELVISVGIIASLLALGVPAFRSYGLKVNFDAQAQSFASLIEDARTLALAPEASKAAAVTSYGIAVDSSSGVMVLNRYAGTSGSPAIVSEVKRLSVPSDVQITRAPSGPVLFPMTLGGEPVFSDVGVGTIELTSRVLQDHTTRTLTINPATGQVSVQ